ncbi:MAG: hypothetical protein M3271_09125 [Actinomycetota bacterium]|nr:hypothetical protein [Actinomycetota bacterium]
MKKTFATLILAVLVAGSPAVAQAKGDRRPANDESSAASVIGALPYSETVNLRGATLQATEPQPSCSPIRSSVWYALSLAEEGKVIGEVSSTFPSALAVYEQSTEGLLQETACGSGQAGSTIQFDAVPNRIYLVQLSATGKKQGIADIALSMSSWREVTLFDQSFERNVDEQNMPILEVKGSPRANDPSMYDVTLTAWQQQTTTVGVLTFGLVTKEINARLVKVPAIATSVRLQVTGRYDSSQYRCAVDDGGNTCYAGSPLQDLNWLTSGDSSKAELVMTMSVKANDRVIVERSQSIPYAGQVLGLIP